MRLVTVILIMILLSAPVLALDKLTGFVNDEAGVITPEFEEAMNAVLYDLKLNTSVELAVATVKTTDGEPIEDYSINLAHNTLGEKGKDNGLLILLAVEDRAYRVEVGYGLEPTIPDVLAARIGDEVMAPRFKEGNYEQGLLDGVVVLSSILKGDDSYETTGTGAPKINSETIKLGFWGFFILIFIIGNIIASYKHAKKKMKGKKDKGERPNSGDFLAAMFIASMFGRGGRGGGGLGGGGFGGFGGGGFGGGGFSGKF
ncbi:MAG: TPM domain-containing protein [Nanoarchaeota archaeon]|nr:TPM domain-containing protein [Nanoarchaeota archaeon]MBU1321835.1 TPM domain-containing protein [Nanoarchaeota archaeon]MBU1597180.1 TPM domain-containing protein [Nanoarchaeota archaeon]MBU2441647.1 TPM domain-containing protein [Nanoarchaeota archaeon]